MAVTLAQAQLNTQDAIQAGVVEIFRKQSWIFDNITFDDAVMPGGQGKTLTYGYTREKTKATAGFRAINAEYTPAEAEKERITVDLKVFGGSFQIDRVINQIGGLVNELDYQINSKTKAAIACFNDTFFNGDSAGESNEFDGLNKALTSSSTEYNGTSSIALDTSANIDTNYKAFLDELDDFLSLLDGTPSFLAGNRKLINKLKAIARRAGYLTQSEDAFGRQVQGYNGIPFLDPGEVAGTSNLILPVVDTRKPNGTDTITGLADLYAVRLAIDGVHAASIAGQNPIKYYAPDFKTSGAVKTGEVEAVAAVVIKTTKSAGVFRNIKVQ